ncbi:TetR/AcrR family transcriptional regulator [Paraferrimonas sedimenticola]|uniref:TetR family transcriptional regulator n=1 Tax=Paraferrimonas sedimenticola TaxID=375674 RepID=A0AA37RUN9_9GAMM|nr:TetR/AcrR family transcriptional regulator [Paraferrimonas sedimenticola]GLP95526.1 TetR family transcriptional regulator [Paraferrimonas sedimenticola]
MSRKSTKRDAILDAALKLFVEQGFEATSTASVARAAEVATGTLFHHFANKQELLDQLYLQVKEDMASILAQSVQGAAPPSSAVEYRALVESVWKQSIETALANPLKTRFFYRFFKGHEVSDSINQQAIDQAIGLIGELLQLGQGHLTHAPLPLMAHMSHSQFLAATEYFMANPELWHQAKHRDAAFQLMWKGISVS